VIMAPPSCFGSMYPYPVGHPADRQSMVELRSPDVRRFPRFADARFVYAVLEPGDVLYIPAYWWHHVDSCFEETISVNFWHRHRSSSRPTPPLPLRDAAAAAAGRRAPHGAAAQH